MACLLQVYMGLEAGCTGGNRDRTGPARQSSVSFHKRCLENFIPKASRKQQKVAVGVSADKGKRA